MSKYYIFASHLKRLSLEKNVESLLILSFLSVLHFHFSDTLEVSERQMAHTYILHLDHT